MDLSVFPDRLRKHRLRTRKTQTQMAAEIGVAQSSYAQWETGQRTPELRHLPAICQVLGVSVEELFGVDRRDTVSGVTLVPILGRIRAGVPLLAEQNVIGEIAAPDRLSGRADFALVVSGDSMSGVGIDDGDIVYMARADRRAPGHGDIVAALVGGADATLKWFVKENGGWWLKAANPKYDPIRVDEGVSIQGIYLGLLMERKPRELDPPLEEMPAELLVQRLAERKGIDPDVLDGVVHALARKKK